MKNKFELDVFESEGGITNGDIKIIGISPKCAPYVKITITERYTSGDKVVSACIKDKDLERFAVNILKALKSKKLK